MTRRHHRPWALLAAGALLLGTASCGSDDHVFSLYRETIDPNVVGLHLATFDADQRREFNQANCENVARLLREQPGVTMRIWCERGRHR